MIMMIIVKAWCLGSPVWPLIAVASNFASTSPPSLPIPNYILSRPSANIQPLHGIRRVSIFLFRSNANPISFLSELDWIAWSGAEVGDFSVSFCLRNHCPQLHTDYRASYQGLIFQYFQTFKSFWCQLTDCRIFPPLAECPSRIPPWTFLSKILLQVKFGTGEGGRL